MSDVSAIPADRGWLRWKATAVEWLSVIIACIAAGIALISMLVNSLALGIIWAQDNRIDQLNDSVEVYRIRAAKLDAYLKAKGVPTDDVYD